MFMCLVWMTSGRKSSKQTVKLNLLFIRFNCIINLDADNLEINQVQTKIEWDKVDSDIYDLLIKTVLNTVEDIVEKSFKILEVAKQKHAFDIHEYWSNFKGGPQKPVKRQKSLRDVLKPPVACKLKPIEKMTLIEKPSSKLRTDSILVTKSKVNFVFYSTFCAL